MDYAAALKAIKDLENGSELAQAIEDKTSTLIGEVRAETKKRRESEGFVNHVLDLTKAEGDTTAAKTEASLASLKELQSQLDTLSSDKAKAESEKEALATEKEKLESQIKARETQDDLRKMAKLANADPEVLLDINRLSGGLQLAANDDSEVLVGEGDKRKTLREFVRAEYPRYESNLFTEAESALPGAPPSGRKQEEKRVSDRIADKRYSLPSRFKAET